jgi:hypothetical protein
MKKKKKKRFSLGTGHRKKLEISKSLKVVLASRISSFPMANLTT